MKRLNRGESFDSTVKDKNDDTDQENTATLSSYVTKVLCVYRR